MSNPRAIVIRTAGTNCDAELVRAFTLAGAHVDLVHVDTLADDPARLDAYALIGFPGGFAHGDDIAAGRVLAVKVRDRLYDRLRVAIDERNACVLGVCNGFQVLVQAGLLPGPMGAGEPLPPLPAPPTVALAHNASDRFIDDWAQVIADPASDCVWTAPLIEHAQRQGEAAVPVALPYAHGEGRFVCPENVLAALQGAGRVALRYADNPNGSAGDVAGICDGTGRVFGLMPHPERYLAWRHHPAATRLTAAQTAGPTPGLAMFAGAVEAARAALVG
jgi:phosphoribosylformylglycinamidine synthase